VIVFILAKDMNKKKRKQRLKDMERRSSEKGMDIMEAHTEMPPKEEVKTVSYLQRSGIISENHYHSCGHTCDYCKHRRLATRILEEKIWKD